MIMHGVSKHATRYKMEQYARGSAGSRKKRSKSLELRLKYVPLPTVGKKVVLTETLMHYSLCGQSLFLCSARWFSVFEFSYVNM